MKTKGEKDEKEENEELVSKAREFVEPILQLAEDEENGVAIIAATKTLMLCDELESLDDDEGKGKEKKRSIQRKEKEKKRKQKSRTNRSRNSFVDANLTGNGTDTFADLEDFIECDESQMYSRQETEAELDARSSTSKRKKR